MAQNRGKGHFWLLVIIGILSAIFGGFIGYMIQTEESLNVSLIEKKGIVTFLENTKQGWTLNLKDDTTHYLIHNILTPSIQSTYLYELNVNEDSCRLLCDSEATGMIYEMSCGDRLVLSKEEAFESYDNNSKVGRVLGGIFFINGLGMVISAFFERKKERKLNALTEEEYESFMVEEKVKEIQQHYFPMILAPYLLSFLKIVEKTFDWNISFNELMKNWIDEIYLTEFTLFHFIATMIFLVVYFFAHRYYVKGIEDANGKEKDLEKATQYHRVLLKFMSILFIPVAVVMISLFSQGNFYLYFVLFADLIFKVIYFFPSRNKILG